VYYFGYPDNYLGAEPNLWFCAALSGLIAGQLGLLFLQSYRKFTWLFCSGASEAFNYHALPSGLPEAQVDFM